MYKLARLSLEQHDGALDGGGSPRSGLSPPRVLTEPEVGAEAAPLVAAAPAVVPCVIQWKHPGTSVFLTGDFNAWTQDAAMMRDGNEFWQVLNLTPGRTYHYKFVVDGEWMYAPDHSTARDARGNMSNYIQVEHWEPNVENEVLLVESPRGSYSREVPVDEDQYTKEPPPVPVHLTSKAASPAYQNDFGVQQSGGWMAGGAAGPAGAEGAGGGAAGGGGDGGDETGRFASKDLNAAVSHHSRSLATCLLPSRCFALACAHSCPRVVI